MKKLLVGIAVIALMAFSAPAQAATIIDFGGGAAATGGTITVTGSLYSGTGILVPTMQLINTPLNAGTYLTTAVLSFGYDGGATNWVHVVGGYVPGGIPDGTLLLNGSFTSFNVMGMPNGGISIQGAGPDAKNRLLLAFAGLSLNTPFEMFGFTLAGGTDSPGVYDPYSTDISNTAVPEPGSMLLLGTGLFGLAGAVRRRMKK